MLKSLINFENHLFFEKKFIKQVPREKKEFLYVDVDLWRSRRLKMAVLEHTKWRIREPQNTRCYGDAQREKRNYYDTSPPLPSAKFLLQEGVLWKDSLIKLDGCSFFGSCSRTEGAYRIFGRCNPKFINWNVLCSKMNLYEFHLFGENFRRFFFQFSLAARRTGLMNIGCLVDVTAGNRRGWPIFFFKMNKYFKYFNFCSRCQVHSNLNS